MSTSAEIPKATTPPSLAGILVVEDDGLLRYAAVNTLTELGYRVFSAAEALEALSLLEEHPDIAVVMTDIKLPGMDGKQLAAEARRRRPQVKILFVTGYSERVIDKAKPADKGSIYLSKPYMPHALENALKRLVSPTC